MARILSSLIGDLRGSIGGQTYSRNKAGAFIRQRVKPVNPQTVRQQTARYRFGNMSIIYQNLSTAAKDCWEVFARTHFNPLKGNNTGIYSGGNAFVALRQSAGQGNTYRAVPEGVQGGGIVNFTTSAYLEVSEPPLTPSSATILDSNGTARLFDININNVDKFGQINYSISFPTGDTDPTATIEKFENAENQLFGIGFYASNSLKFEGAKPNTALKINFSDTGVITELEKGITGAGPTVETPIIMTNTSVVVKENTRDFPCAGDVILVTPFIRTIDGAQKLMPPKYVTVAESLI